MIKVHLAVFLALSAPPCVEAAWRVLPAVPRSGLAPAITHALAPVLPRMPSALPAALASPASLPAVVTASLAPVPVVTNAVVVQASNDLESPQKIKRLRRVALAITRGLFATEFPGVEPRKREWVYAGPMSGSDGPREFYARIRYWLNDRVYADYAVAFDLETEALLYARRWTSDGH